MTWLDKRLDHLIRGGLLVFLGLVVFKSAWLGDDAYISLRTVENLVEGRGLTWNAGERVQVFTHPLWLWFVTGVRALVPSGYWSLILASLITSLATGAIVIWRLASSTAMAALAIGALALSKWWVDFATSGLENPLLFLLAGLFGLAWSRKDQTGTDDPDEDERHLLLLTVIVGLAVLTRADTLLLFGPPLLVRAVGLGRRAWRPLLLGMLPLILWEIFSVVWFGFPLSNTAYAKLNTGLPALLMAKQGLRYLGFSVRTDPVLGLTIVMGMVAMLRRPRTNLSLLIGLGLYLLYVVRIGGCFMGGRFLTLPFFIAVCLLVGLPLPARRWRWTAAAVLALALLIPRNPVTCAFDYREPLAHAGIVDERAYYFPTTGVWHRLDGDFEEHVWALEGRRARALAEIKGQQGFHLTENIGFYAYEAGPPIYVVDPYALASPFLARFPGIPPEAYPNGWRIGHYRRAWPEGFRASLAMDTNKLVDSGDRDLYDDLQRVTRGPLFTRARWGAIWRLNTQRF